MGDQGCGHQGQRVGEDRRRSLLKQLAVGLSVHRLYPEDPGTPAFVAACTRIRERSEQALSGGPVHVELRSGQLIFDDDRDDQSLARLAEACFERRVEHLYVVSPPQPEELSALFSVLCTAPAAVDAAGGVATLLDRAGVRSVLATEEEPAAARGAELPAHLTGIADPGAPGVGDAVGAAVRIQLEPDDDARTLYARLGRTAATLPEDAVARSPFYRHADGLVAQLPVAQQPAFGRLLFDAQQTDPFAARFLGHLTDHRLAELIVRVAEHEGIHPATLARQLGGTGSRGATLPRLALDLLDDPVPRSDASPGSPGTQLAVAFPNDPGQGRTLALTALLDVLLNDPRPELLERILLAITEQLRHHLLTDEPSPMIELLTVLRRAHDLNGWGGDRPLQRPWTDTLDAETVAALAVDAERVADSRRTDQIRIFGANAVRPVLEVLSTQPPPAIHRALSDTLATLVSDHLDALYHHLGELPPESLAALAGVLARLGGHRVLPLLDRLALHPSSTVLLPTIDALAGQHPSAALPLLDVVLRRNQDLEVRRHVIEIIAGFDADDARAQLRTLARRSSSPLPFRLRRLAARAARRSRP